MLKLIVLLEQWSKIVELLKGLFSKAKTLAKKGKQIAKPLQVNKIAIVCNNDTKYKEYLAEFGFSPRLYTRVQSKPHLRGFKYAKVIYIHGYF